MPRHDPTGPAPKRIPSELIAEFVRQMRRPRRPPPRPGGVLEPEPVEPPRPRPLSGGAAAELEFDD